MVCDPKTNTIVLMRKQFVKLVFKFWTILLNSSSDLTHPGYFTIVFFRKVCKIYLFIKFFRRYNICH